MLLELELTTNFVSRGILLQHSGRLSEAASSYQSAIKFRPKLALAYLNLGITLAELGRKDDAINILDKCSKLDDNGLKDPKANANARISAMFHLGKLLLESREPRRAISVLLTGLGAGEGRETILGLLGDAHQALGQTGAAEEWYSQAVLTNPAYVSSHLMMAKMLAKNVSNTEVRHGLGTEQCLITDLSGPGGGDLVPACQVSGSQRAKCLCSLRSLLDGQTEVH